MPLFSKKSPISTELIFDIESDSVCAAIVLYEANKVPHIVYHAESEIGRKVHTDGAYLLKNMLKALEMAAADAQKALVSLLEKKTIEHSAVNRIHIVLSSPWIISKLSCVEKVFEEETIIRHKDAADLLEKERDASAKLFAIGDSAAIDAKLFEVKINGYPVTVYEGKHAKALEGTMVVSFASRKMLSEIKLRVNKSFRARDEAFHSALILRYITLRSILPHHVDYVWLQIHGELTDVLFVREGECAVSASLPFGYDTLVRRFASLTGESEQIAVSSLVLSENGSNTAEAANATGASLEKIMAEWTSGITRLVSLGEESALPPIVYVSTGKYSFVFESALRRFSQSISVRKAAPDIVASFVEYAPSVSVDVSASLYAAALPLSQKL